MIVQARKEQFYLDAEKLPIMLKFINFILKSDYGNRQIFEICLVIFLKILKTL